MASANYRQAQVQLAQAKLDLDRTEVRAPCEGFVTNLDLHVGAYLHAGTAVMALVHADDFYVAGYFEETRLARIQPGPQHPDGTHDHRVVEEHQRGQDRRERLLPAQPPQRPVLGQQ